MILCQLFVVLGQFDSGKSKPQLSTYKPLNLSFHYVMVNKILFFFPNRNEILIRKEGEDKEWTIRYPHKRKQRRKKKCLILI